MGAGKNIAHSLGYLGVGHFDDVVDLPLQNRKGLGVGHAAGHAVGQQRGHRGFHHVAGGQRVGVGRGVGADHTNDAGLLCEVRHGDAGAGADGDEAAATLTEWLSRESVVLATVLDTRGAVPRHRGAQMLVAATRTSGSVGGGRLEALVIDEARALLARGERIGAVAIDLTGREGAQGICGGTMQVALRCWQGNRDAARAQLLAETLSSGKPVTLDADDLGHDSTHTLQPTPRLLIIGAGHCGLALTRAAALLDYDIHVVDARAEGYDHADFVGGQPLLVAGSMAEIAAQLNEDVPVVA